ncbi:capsid protein [Capybara virus 25_cap1_1914]|uniref:Capsid protein n=1 Tax=Capybara virus 25_cap1_1914 TaxID=2585053 RepID=A0A514TRZ1_9VIRU|nr:capsid protein [Capybara virus 25_cap1_1914]
MAPFPKGSKRRRNSAYNTPRKTPRKSYGFTRRPSVFSNTSVPSDRPRSRSNSTASTVSWPSSILKRGGPSYNNVNATGGTAAQKAFSRSGRKISKRNRGKKRIKVGRKFRKKVKESLRYLAPSGYAQETFYNIYRPGDKSQGVFDLGTGFQVTSGLIWGASQEDSGAQIACFFDAAKVMDAASILFNNAPLTPIKRYINATALSNLFDARQTQIDVLKQWVQFEIKNNTGRRLKLKFWVWELKNNTDSQKIDRNFRDEWAHRLNNELTPPGGAGQTGNKLNVASANINTIGMSPLISPGMQSIYNVEEIIIDLEPGRVFYKNIQGPSKMYDFSKMWQAERGFTDDFSVLCKGTKGMCMCVIPDMVTDTPGSGSPSVGRLTNLPSTSGFGVLVATTYNYVIRMPEQTGFTYLSTTGGTQQMNNARRDHPYSVQQWHTVGPNSNNLNEVNDENPQEPVQPQML